MSSCGKLLWFTWHGCANKSIESMHARSPSISARCPLRPARFGRYQRTLRHSVPVGRSPSVATDDLFGRKRWPLRPKLMTSSAETYDLFGRIFWPLRPLILSNSYVMTVNCQLFFDTQIDSQCFIYAQTRIFIQSQTWFGLLFQNQTSADLFIMCLFVVVTV